MTLMIGSRRGGGFSDVWSKILAAVAGWMVSAMNSAPVEFELGAPAELLGVGDAGHPGARLGQDALVGVEVGYGEVDHPVALRVTVTWLKSTAHGEQFTELK
jgi:hypothetical protein